MTEVYRGSRDKVLHDHLSSIGRGNKEAGLALLDEARIRLEDAYETSHILVDEKNNVLVLQKDGEERASPDGTDYPYICYMTPWIQEKKLIVLFQLTCGGISKERTLEWFLEMRNRQMSDTRRMKIMYQKHAKGSWYLRGTESPAKIVSLIRDMEAQLNKDIKEVDLISCGNVPAELKEAAREEFYLMEKEW